MTKFFKENRIFLILFFIAVSIRFINITMPILEGTATRQVQTANIARNFYRQGFNIFYPEVDYYGPGKTYMILEFPLLNLLAALGYKFLGGPYEWVGRLLSILFFSGGLLFIYLLTKEIFGKDVAFWVSFAFSFSPLSIIFSRTFMPEFEMIFFCLGAIYFMYLFTKKEKIKYFWISNIFSMFALLIKPHSFYIIIPLLYLFLKKEKTAAFLQIKNWLYLLIAFLPASLWYIRAAFLQWAFIPEEAYNFEIFHWMKLSEFFTIGLYKDLLNIYPGIFLTPIGLSLLILGLFLKTKEKENLIWAWLGGIILFVLAFVSHIDEPYYNLNILPVASIFIGHAIVFLKENSIVNRTYLNNKFAKIVVSLITLIFIVRYALLAYIVPSGYKYLPEAGMAIQLISKSDDLVIASSAGSPAALYYCDRKGWPFLLPGPDEKKTKEAIDKLEGYRKMGAKFFLAAVPAEFNRSYLFKDYMYKHFEVVEQKGGRFIIFRLR